VTHWLLDLLTSDAGGFQLRPYQTKLVEECHQSRTAGFRAPLIVLGTGAGKTSCFTQLTLDLVAGGERVWIIAHRKELISQASKTLTRAGVAHGIVKSGIAPTPDAHVQVASVQTIVRRLDHYPAPDVIITDEAHHAVSATYRKIFDRFPHAWLPGVTATPCLLSGRGLRDVFDTLILGPGNKWLTDNGYLPSVRYFAPPEKADFSHVRTTMGDCNLKDLEQATDTSVVTGDAVGHYQRVCPGLKMIVFCVSVQHAEHVAQEYRDAGYRAVSVDGGLSDEDRDDRIEGLGTGKYEILTSCELIGEGLDVPSVGAVQLLRRTESLRLYLQQVGRALRGDGTVIVLDHVGNVLKHGMVSQEREWSLDGVKKTTAKAKEAVQPIRTCSTCYSVHPVSAVCPYCGFTYPRKERAAPKTEDGELVEILEVRMKENPKAMSFSDLVALAKARGYKNPTFWAMQRKKPARASLKSLPPV
jgi:DNA repair protein RadD